MLILARAAGAQSTRTAVPASQPADGRLPQIQVDTQRKQVRMDCEAVNAEMALEFLVCVTGTAEHETVLRSKARPSHLHLALLMIGLEPGEPVTYLENQKKWLPPRGPRLKVTCEFVKDGKLVSLPAWRLMRDQRTKREMAETDWVFTGSRTTAQGDYAADITGHLISLVNFPFTPIDVPQLKSSSNEALELEVNPQAVPPRGTRVTVIIEKAP